MRSPYPCYLDASGCAVVTKASIAAPLLPWAAKLPTLPARTDSVTAGRGLAASSEVSHLSQPPVLGHPMHNAPCLRPASGLIQPCSGKTTALIATLTATSTTSWITLVACHSQATMSASSSIESVGLPTGPG